MKPKDLFFVLVGPDLAEEKNDQNQYLGDPPLSPGGISLLEKLRMKAYNLNSDSIQAGTGKRFIQAVMAVFPGRESFSVSPLWGDPTIIRNINGQECIVLGNGLILGRDKLYDQLPPTPEEDWTMELLRTSTIDSVYNLPTGSIVFTEERTLRIMGMPSEQLASGSLYYLHTASSGEMPVFDLVDGPQKPVSLVA